MRLRRTAVALALGFTCLGTALTGCDFILQPTKVGGGQLYQSGEGKYDPYFAAVHQEQVTSANWPDEAKASRKPIVTALDLRPGTSNSTILAATRSKKGDASLGSAIEQTTASEIERARRLTAAAAKLDDMEKRGDELKKQAALDRKNLGADKADEKKVAKADEVKREMSAAVDAVESMSSDARKGAREAEELATKLKAAWTGKDEDARPMRIEEKRKEEEKKEEKKEEEKREEKHDEKKKPEPIAKKPKADAPVVAKKPAKPEPEEKKPPEEKPAKTPPPQKPADEVFNP